MILKDALAILKKKLIGDTWDDLGFSDYTWIN